MPSQASPEENMATVNQSPWDGARRSRELPTGAGLWLQYWRPTKHNGTFASVYFCPGSRDQERLTAEKHRCSPIVPKRPEYDRFVGFPSPRRRQYVVMWRALMSCPMRLKKHHPYTFSSTIVNTNHVRTRHHYLGTGQTGCIETASWGSLWILFTRETRSR